jgi:hypothetical protein
LKTVTILMFQMSTVLDQKSHNHARSDASTTAEKVKMEMKDAAKRSRACPTQIVADALVQHPVDVRAAVGNLESVKRDLRNQKRGNRPTAPASLDSFSIKDEWTTTGYPDYRPFLIYDSGAQSHERVIVFGSDRALQHLSRARVWYMDGTFETAPHLFKQLYVIRAPAGESSVTCVYAFLSGKSQALYELLFRGLNDHCRSNGYDLEPERIKVDFEQAVFRAIASVYGTDVTVSGCYYHLTQSTYRKIQELGLATQYSNNAEVHHFCGMLDGLAFLPIDTVSDGMQLLHSLVHKLPQLTPLLEYFDTTYVSGAFRSSQVAATGGQGTVLRLTRRTPIFPPSTWNVYEATVNDQPRTNNICEAWNNGFKIAVGHSHPDIYTSVDAIRKDEAACSTLLHQLDIGQPPKKRVRRESHNLQQRLKGLCTDYRDGKRSLTNFMRALGHNIHMC